MAHVQRPESELPRSDPQLADTKRPPHKMQECVANNALCVLKELSAVATSTPCSLESSASEAKQFCTPVDAFQRESECP